ncbi:GGDEF domain-containing protein [Novosphingobium sp. ERW19]|nr:GGDEF domain-containing protein [Novosphingobium sp. ERW19]
MLLDEISTFLLDNALAVTASNLLAAHSAFSGIDVGLARKILEKQASGTSITQEWLDLNKTPDGMQEGVKKIIGSLEASLETFASTTRTARDAVTTYNSEIKKQVSRATSLDADSALSALGILAREMVSRTENFAAEMKRSEDEAQALRRELDKARHDAEIDHLTGLPNRRAFEAALDRHYRQARQEADHLCVAFCDIDHFKRVNDTHGHDTGDRVIKAIGEALARISDDTCHVARHGGEEFVMLFRGKTTQEAWEKLDAVRENFGSRQFVNRANDNPIGKITFSGGIADVFAHKNPRDALKAADEALYEAKSGGRNQIVLSSPVNTRSHRG